MIYKLLLFAVPALAVALAGCSSTGSSDCCCSATGSSPCTISKAPFGKTLEGEAVDIYALTNANGVEARICTYGGILVSFKCPDRDGKMGDVVLGYDNLDGYLTNSPYFGAMIGRYGNRIAKGKFTLDDVNYTLATNNGPNALHGGLKGFDKRVWQAKVDPEFQFYAADSSGKATQINAGPSLELTYTSKDGEEGYPGNLKVKAVYTLMPDNGLRLEYTATTDKDTVLNLTQHSYFNLAGQGDVLGHKVYIDADKFTPVDETLIPTGELRPVKGTPFDFRQPTAIGARIKEEDKQLKFGNGYDHNWVLKHPMGRLDVIARVTEPTTGRELEVLSTEPGLQFYTGNFLDGTIAGKGGQVYNFRNAFCMEPQHYPNSPNQSDFPSAALRPGQVYHNTIIFRLSTSK
jgi:aldose 1-epimerase